MAINQLHFVNDFGRQIAQGRGGIVPKVFLTVQQDPADFFALGFELSVLDRDARHFSNQLFGIRIGCCSKGRRIDFGGIAALLHPARGLSNFDLPQFSQGLDQAQRPQGGIHVQSNHSLPGSVTNIGAAQTIAPCSG